MFGCFFSSLWLSSLFSLYLISCIQSVTLFSIFSFVHILFAMVFALVLIDQMVSNTVCLPESISILQFFLYVPVLSTDPEEKKRRLTRRRSFGEFATKSKAFISTGYTLSECVGIPAWNSLYFLCFFRWPKVWCRLSIAHSILSVGILSSFMSRIF